jgi:hypothetical protein
MLLKEVYRLTTFVPPDHLDAVLAAVTGVDPLRYGPYDCSAWWGEGTEQYRPLPGSNPTHGAVGGTERVPTVRLEFAIARDPDLLQRVLDALVAAHPWQEPAVFIDASIAKISNPEIGK